jgi:hypothetical protein
MSLIVTSSSQNDAYDQIGNNQIERPFSYQNYFKTPIKLKPNSKIAVESVKVQASTNLNFTNDDKMSFYFGEELTLESTNLLSYPIHLNFGDNLLKFNDLFRAGNDTQKNLSMELAADRIEKCLKESVLHPVLFDKPNVTVLLDGSTSLTKGFKIQLDQRSGSGVNNVISQNFIDAHPNTDINNFDYNNGTFTQQSATANLEDCECCGIATDRPILNTGGEIEFDIDQIRGDTSKHWQIGLCRSLRNADGEFPNTPSYYDETGATGGFCDFFVKWDGTQIRVGYMAADVDQEEILYYDDVKYYHASGSFTTPITAFGDLTAVKFVLKNELMEVYMYDSIKAEWKALVEQQFTDKDKNFKPICQNTWTMFPYIQLATQNSEITIANAAGLDHSTDYDPSINNWYTLATNPVLRDLSQNTTCWNHQNLFVQKMDTLSISDPSTTDTKTRKLLNASNVNDYSFVLLVGDNKVYNNKSVDGFIPNVGEKLGYGLKAIINQTLYGTVAGSLVTFDSLTKSSALSTRSFFVRLNTTAHDSYNGATNSISKILAHFPTTDSSGRDSGILYFEKSNLIYLDLNNPTELQLQDLKIDLVYVNETFADCFVGNTVVTLHIKND